MKSKATWRDSGLLAKAKEISRASEWWDYKFVPIFALFYATALNLGRPIWTLWPAAITLLVALVPGAIYVSVINDISDREDDRAAGKINRMDGRPLWQSLLLAGTPFAAGMTIAWSWRADLPLCLAYLSAWTAFSLYSIPPFRLKSRGLAGVFADASGAHLFPTLVGILLVYRFTGEAADWVWISCAACWSFACGLRGILWHQLSDLENDRAANVRTFACRTSVPSILAASHLCLFPVEVASLAGLLLQIGTLIPTCALLLYLLLVRRRIGWWDMSAVIVQPKPRYLILLHEYYLVFFPLSILLASALRHPADALVVLAHLAVFPGRTWAVATESWRLRTHSAAHRPAT